MKPFWEMLKIGIGSRIYLIKIKFEDIQKQILNSIRKLYIYGYFHFALIFHRLFYK
jgi:hypothetical protein